MGRVKQAKHPTSNMEHPTSNQVSGLREQMLGRPLWIPFVLRAMRITSLSVFAGDAD